MNNGYIILTKNYAQNLVRQLRMQWFLYYDKFIYLFNLFDHIVATCSLFFFKFFLKDLIFHSFRHWCATTSNFEPSQWGNCVYGKKQCPLLIIVHQIKIFFFCKLSRLNVMFCSCVLSALSMVRLLQFIMTVVVEGYQVPLTKNLEKSQIPKI